MFAMFVIAVSVFAAIFTFFWIFRGKSEPVKIQGRHVFITGGSSGIGLEIAKLAAKEGAGKITLLARDLNQLHKAKQEVIHVSDRNIEVCIASADVVDFSSLERVFKRTGSVDILVCCHGLAIPRAFEDAPIEELNRIVNVNLMGTINVVKAASPVIKDPGNEYARSIALFSSQAGQVGIYGYVAYAAAKGGVRNLAEALRHEVLGHRIQVTVIYPPDTNTPGFLEENKTKPEITKQLSASSSAMEAVDVARKSLEGIKAGRFCVPCNFDGLLLAIASSAMSPQTSAVYGMLEFLALPLVRMISLYVHFDWSRKIANWQKKKN